MIPRIPGITQGSRPHSSLYTELHRASHKKPQLSSTNLAIERGRSRPLRDSTSPLRTIYRCTIAIGTEKLADRKYSLDSCSGYVITYSMTVFGFPVSGILVAHEHDWASYRAAYTHIPVPPAAITTVYLPSPSTIEPPAHPLSEASTSTTCHERHWPVGARSWVPLPYTWG